MKKTLFLKVWMILMVLTIVSALISESNLLYASVLVIVLSVVKFLGVSFYFMELRKAHVFWRSSVLIFVIIFSVISIILI